jgi:serine protease Do
MGRRILSFIILPLVFLFSCDSKADLWHEKSTEPSVTASKSVELSSTKADFVELAKKLNPTVVNVFTTHIVKFSGSPRGVYKDDMFRMFEQFFGRDLEMPREQKSNALGSGFIINKDGYIITNNHVINGADKISVKLFDGKEYSAKLIGSDEETDVAVIKIEAKSNLPFVYLGDSSKTQVGEWAVAIGNPLGHSNTVTAGIVSAKGRLMPEVSFYNDFIQTDAAINPGNSGGPLVNVNGEVIGINTAINRLAGSNMGAIPIEGIGFAIPINNVKGVLQSLVKGEKVAHKNTWLGVALSDISDSLATNLKLDDSAGGAIVTDVLPNSPAAKAGIIAYDVVTSFDGNAVKSSGELILAIKRATPGKTYNLDVIRDGKKKIISVTLIEKKEDDKVSPKEKKEQQQAVTTFGVKVRAAEKGEGVVVTDIDQGTAAAFSGLMQGDLILEVNKQKVNTPTAFYNALNKDSNLFKIKRGEQILVLAFSMK